MFTTRRVHSFSSHTDCNSSGTKASASLTHDVDALNVFGLRNMPWKASTDSAAAPRVIDLDWLVHQPDLPFLVQALPAQTLHRSLLAHGFDDSLEVIEWIRGRQLVRFMDFELWEENTESATVDISSDKAILWLRRWLEIGSVFAAERISDLEEETLVLLFTKLIDVEVQGLSRFDIENHDDYWTTADGRYHLRVKSQDPAAFEVIKQAVDSLYALDIKWAGSILAHVSMLLRDESLEMAQKWREGRLSDAGFVSREEALSVLRPRPMEALKADLSKAISMEIARNNFREKMGDKAREADDGFADSISSEIVSDMKESFRALLCDMEPETAVRTIEAALGAENVKQLTDGAKFQAEFFVEDEAIMEEAVASVVARTRTILMKIDAVYERNFREHRLLVEQVFAHISEENPEKCSELKTRLARVVNMFLSGTAFSPDADAQERSVAVVRGCINLGLELCLSSPKDFSLPSSISNNSSTVYDASKALQLVGPEYLFQLGWSSLSELSSSCAVAVELALPQGVVRSSRPLAILLQAQRFAEIRKWLSTVESHMSLPVFHVISSLINRVPLYPEVLSLEGHVLSASADRRAFETLADLEKSLNFVQKISKIDLKG